MSLEKINSKEKVKHENPTNKLIGTKFYGYTFLMLDNEIFPPLINCYCDKYLVATKNRKKKKRNLNTEKNIYLNIF